MTKNDKDDIKREIHIMQHLSVGSLALLTLSVFMRIGILCILLWSTVLVVSYLIGL